MTIASNNITYKCCNIGIAIENGGYNEIRDNRIRNTSNSYIKGRTSVGIAIMHSKDNYIINNNISAITSNPNDEIYHYWVNNPNKMNNTIKVSDLSANPWWNTDKHNCLNIVQGDCACFWDEDGLKNCRKVSDPTNKDCTICCVDDEDTHTWRC